MQREGIAIIGIGCRFPGDINDTEAFWRVLAEGRDVVSSVPPDRWNVERFYDAEPGIAGKSIARRGGFISGIDQFDPQFFGISPREAAYIDPQQRLLLETAWEAIEDAGVVLDIEHGTNIGVYAGISHTDYQSLQGSTSDRSRISPHSPTGNAHSIAANRISYCLNLTGPSLSLDTACSSALTAVHLACEQIRAGRCAMALAGGVTVMILPDGFIGFSQAGMLSPDGKCQSFDAGANGFVRGEGAGLVLLKPLSLALADGNPIYGVIIGTALNQDGHTNGISVPNPDAQARLLGDACIDAGIRPSQVGYVETHGGGTAVGDPIEASALSSALCAERSADAPLPIGSVKTNLGHLETAAGVAGLIKAALVLQHAQIPASLHFTKPNPQIDFATLKLRVPIALEAFPKIAGRRIAGVNSFGFGGANAHVLVEEAPDRAGAVTSRKPEGRGWPLVFSARSATALKAVAARMAEWVESHSKSGEGATLLPDLTYTLGARRNHHPHRFTVIAHSAGDLALSLREFTGRTSFTPRAERGPRIAFVMSGQGPQWWGMGRELTRSEPVFRKTIEACAEAMRPHARFSLLDELNRDDMSSRLQETEIAQPAIFAVQLALAELWKSIAVPPAAIIGHSVGEIAAACVAGVLSLAEGARISVLRAQVMQDCARGEGAMLAVGLNSEEALAVIARHDRTVSIAAFNGPRSLTLAGTRASLQAILAELEAGNVFARFVRVDHPFHHAMMQPAAEAFAAEFAALAPQAENVPFFSSVTGRRCAGKDCTADYWASGIRQAVLFAPAVNAIADFGVDLWLEIGCHPALSISIQECLAARAQKSTIVASTRREREHDSFLEAALELHRAGVIIDFGAFTPSRNLLSLPAYPWDNSRCWHESSELREGRMGAGGRGFLEMRLSQATPTWHTRLDSRHTAFLKDHKVESHLVFPGAAFVEMALEAGIQLFEGRSFVVEELEIRKPLVLPDPMSEVLIELTCDPAEGTFSISSRFEQASSWSLHVTGSLRGERTQSSFAETTWQSGEVELKPQGVDQFYTHMSELGMRFGEEFKPIRELLAGGGKSVGKVALSSGTAQRAAEYAVHPVLLDGALQVFGAAAVTVEPRRTALKLPVRFARIAFLRSPGASGLVEARVLNFNDELTEGRIALYSDAGLPCVLIEGFRAVTAAASAAGRDLIYHVDWVLLAATITPARPQPVPLNALCAAAGKALDEVIALRGRSRLQSAIAAHDEVVAAQIAQGLCAMGVEPASGMAFSADSLAVAQAMQPLFGRLVSKLSKRRLLTARNGSYKPNAKFAKAAASATEVLRRFIALHPGHWTDALSSTATATFLGAALRGEEDSDNRGNSLLSMACITGALKEAGRHLPEGRELRVLEFGAGVSAESEVGAYDFIVSATADVRDSLRSLLTLLAPGGTLMICDDATQCFWMDSIPSLTRMQWESALLECGFAETASLAGLTGPDGSEVQIAVIGRKAEVATTTPVAVDLTGERSWLIFAAADALGQELAARIRAAGARCRIVSRGAQFAWKSADSWTIREAEPSDWTKLWTSILAEDTPGRIIHLWSLDTLPGDIVMGTGGLLHLMRALEETAPVAELRIDLVTRGAQPAGPDRAVSAAEQAAAIGMLRVIGNEYPYLTCRSIDLPPAPSPSDGALLWSELLHADSEREIALRGEARYGRRFTSGMPTRKQTLDPSVSLRLESRERGRLDSLRFTPFVPQNPGPGEVLIKVAAAGMNFRDVLKGLSLYPAETADARIFGDEIAGEVLAVGEGVQHLKPGDRAFGLARSGLATHVLARAAGVLRIPAGLSFEEAATIPVVFMTAWHSLKAVARLKSGETILIHAGAGGVGMAAIQIAHHLGATVIASAGSPAKRRLLKIMGVSDVLDSRQEDFAESVMELTHGRGVDVVLNALASEAIPMGLSCLAEGGRFVEIGKRDVYENSRIPLWPLRRNGSFHVVAMDAVFSGDEKPVRALLAELTRLVGKKRLRPLPFRSFPASRIAGAFRLMAAGKHTGKVVIAFAEPFVERHGEPPLPEFAVKPDAAYLITGGLGGFGRVLSEWLVECGARHLVLINRSGANTLEAVGFVEKLRSKGVEVRVISADIGSPEQVQRAIAKISATGIPLKGVFHLAMVLDDAPLSTLTSERLMAVMAPKAHGAWLLHENTRSMDLDCFVLFSSVSGVFGQQGQGSYAAANAFLDALAHQRRTLGLPALAIDWGVLGGEGVVARNPRVAELLLRQGLAALSTGEVTMLLESFLLSHATQVAAIRADWPKWRQSFRNMQEDPFVQRFFTDGVNAPESASGIPDWKSRIASAAPNERDGVIGQAVRDVVGAVVHVKPDSLRDDHTLTELGLDSLMGVEIETMIEGSIGVSLPPRSLLRARTIAQIAALISQQFQSPADPATPAAAATSLEAVDVVDAIDLDALSDQDIDRLFQDATR